MIDGRRSNIQRELNYLVRVLAYLNEAMSSGDQVRSRC